MESCSVSFPEPDLVHSGQGLEHDFSGLWIHQVKPVDSLLPIRNAPHITGREATEFYNFFLDK